LEGKALV